MALKSRNYYESLLSNPNIQRALATIRKAEGANYNTLFGGRTFSSFAQHPLQQRAIRLPNGKTTSAAGAYQYERGTWDSLQQQLGLADFSPRNQDIGAVALLDEKNSIPDILAGNVPGFVNKNKPTWESFVKRPFSEINNFWNGGGGVTASGGASLPGGFSYQTASVTIKPEDLKPISPETKRAIILVAAGLTIVVAVIYAFD